MTSSELSSYRIQFEEKVNYLNNLLTDIYDEKIDAYESIPTHYRMRAEFRIWHDGDDTFHIMFDQSTKEKYRVEHLPAAHTIINDAMMTMVEQLRGNECLRKKLYQIDYLCTTSNELVISMIYHKTLDETWVSEVEKLKAHFSALSSISFIGRAKKQKVLVDKDFVIEKLNINNEDFLFKQVENSFTQPNAKINVDMIEWVTKQCADKKGDLLELYCGAGNFSVPLSRVFNKVVGTEISKSSVAAAQYNIETNQIDNLTIVRLSSEEFVQAMRKDRAFNRLKGVDLSVFKFDTVLVDPPRAGLDNETLNMIKEYSNIIYISCNPNTLIENLHVLNTTHKIKKAAMFDQFPFTKHIESGVYLQKR